MSHLHIFHALEGKPRTKTQLAAELGISPRKVSFYISEGLVDPCCGAGRGAFYTDRHAKQLTKVISAREQGRTIADIVVARSLSPQERASVTPKRASKIERPVRQTLHRLELSSHLFLFLDGTLTKGENELLRRLMAVRSAWLDKLKK